MFQGSGIVGSKVLSVQQRKIPRLEYVHNLTKRWNVGSRENALSDPWTEWTRLVASNEMQESTSRISDTLMDDTPQVFVMFPSNVLHHTHGDKGVVMSRDIPVVVLDKFLMMTEVCLLRALSREKNLLF